MQTRRPARRALAGSPVDLLGRPTGPTYWADLLGRPTGPTYWADLLGSAYWGLAKLAR